MEQQANLGSLNIVTGVSTRVGLPLDYIFPMLDKLNATALYNKQKFSETKIGLNNLPIVDEAIDKPEIDRVNGMVDETFKSIDENDDWMAATGTTIKLAETLATDKGLKELNTRVSSFMNGEKEVADNKELSQKAKNANTIRNLEAYRSIKNEDGTYDKFTYQKWNSNLDLEPYKEKMIDLASKLKASQTSFMELKDAGLDTDTALEQLGIQDAQLKSVFKTTLLKSGTVKELTEEEIQDTVTNYLSTDPMFKTTLYEVALADHILETGTSKVDATHLRKYISNTKSPEVQEYLVSLSPMYIKDVSELNNLKDEYDSATSAGNATLQKELYNKIITKQKAISTSKDVYVQDGSTQTSWIDKASQDDVVSTYFGIRTAPLANSIFRVANNFAYREEDSDYKEIGGKLADLAIQSIGKGAIAGGLNPYLGNQAIGSGIWQVDPNAVDPDGELSKSMALLKSLRDSGAQLTPKQIDDLNQYETQINNQKLTVISSFNNLSPEEKEDALNHWSNLQGHVKTEEEYNRNNNDGYTKVTKQKQIDSIANRIKTNKIDLKSGIIDDIAFSIINSFTSSEKLINMSDSEIDSYVMKELVEIKKQWGNSLNKVSAKQLKETKSKLIQRRDNEIHSISKFLAKEGNKDKVVVPFTETYLDPNLKAVSSLSAHVMSAITAQSANFMDVSGKAIYDESIEFGLKTNSKEFTENMKISVVTANGASNAKGRVLKITAPKIELDKDSDNYGKVIPGQWTTVYANYDKADELYDAAIVEDMNSQISNMSNAVYQPATISRISTNAINLGSNCTINGESAFEYLRLRTSNGTLANKPQNIKVNTGGREFNFTLSQNGKSSYTLTNAVSGGKKEEFRFSNISEIVKLIGGLSARDKGLDPRISSFILNQYLVEQK